MTFEGLVVVVSRTNPEAQPLVLDHAKIVMEYDYPDHTPQETIIIKKLVITPMDSDEL